jgi:hypothetical protein
MRKLYFLIAILFLSSAVNAQYSFDAANTNPSAGNTYTLYKVETSVPVGAAGADVSYDFSSQSTATEVTGKWEATTTGSPDIFYSDPNVGVPDIKFSYDSTIYFYLTSSNGLQTVGRATSYGGIFGVYQQMPYNVKANVFSYPFDYGDKETTTLDIAYSYLVQGQPVTGNVTGPVTYEYDGYGNITLPDGKYVSDVARVKVTENFNRSLGGGIDSVRNTFYEYREAFTPTWVARVERYRVILTNGTKYLRDNSYFVKGSEVQNVSELIENSNNISVYPNPTADFANVSFYLPQRSDVLISVTDILGNETTIKQFFDASAGDYQERIDLNEFANGYYLIKLKINGEVQAQKIQKF